MAVTRDAAADGADARGGGVLVEPAPVQDEMEAGIVWRRAALESFRKRIDAALEAVTSESMRDALLQELARAEEETKRLDALAAEQARGESSAPWWADGEYDKRRADEQNDAGIRFLGEQKLGRAFDAFTRAIRLFPSVAAYHSNRALCALRLRRFDVALRDAQNAAARDEASATAKARVGRALLGLGRADEAAEAFREALARNASAAGAESGLRRATAAAAALREERATATEKSNTASRPALAAVDDDEAHEAAASLLIAADEVLKSQPNCEEARLRRAEALVLCSRYEEALGSATDCLVDGVERHYIRAEASFRSGDPMAAASHINEALTRNARSSKCLDLKADIERFIDAVDDTDAALDTERFSAAAERVSGFFADVALRARSAQVVISAYNDRAAHGDAAVASALARACPRLCRAELLQRRARALTERGMTDEATADIDEALRLAPNRISCLRVRSALLRRLRDYEACIATLYRLSAAAPGDASVMAAMTEVAALALNEQEGPAARRSDAARKELAAVPGSHYAVLEVEPAASEDEIRRAYRRLAAVWHPDKRRQKGHSIARGEKENTVLQHASDDGEGDAKFRAIQVAYEVLGDPAARVKYDADVLRLSSLSL